MPAAFDRTELARSLSDADRDGRRLVSVLLPVPGNAAEAFATQHETLALNSWTTAGYKVAIRPDGSSVSAPMAHIVPASADGTAIFERPALDAVEVEICFTLGTELAPCGPDGYSRETLLQHVATIHSGVEFLGHRLDDGSKSQALVFLADRLGNAGYVLGDTLGADVLLHGRSYPLTVTVNGETLFAGPGTHPNGDPVAPLLAFANALTQAVPAGTVVTTGSLCGAVAMPHNAEVVVGGFTALRISARSSAHPG